MLAAFDTIFKDLKSANPTIQAVRYDRMGLSKQEPVLLVGL